VVTSIPETTSASLPTNISGVKERQIYRHDNLDTVTVQHSIHRTFLCFGVFNCESVSKVCAWLQKSLPRSPRTTSERYFRLPWARTARPPCQVSEASTCCLSIHGSMELRARRIFCFRCKGIRETPWKSQHASPWPVWYNQPRCVFCEINTTLSVPIQIAHMTINSTTPSGQWSLIPVFNMMYLDIKICLDTSS
jgi:hypothetical protein